ncbi:HAT C-terminal dimerization domain-containing protein [Plasmodiophora brassicae]
MEPTLRASLDGLDSSSAFDDSWKAVKDRFPILQQFCGGIATVFPHNAQVESDFSIVKSLKDQFRVAITDLSLEGCQHCMQYEYLQSLTFE